MKTKLLTLIALTFTVFSFGQAPESFKYQAVVRDAGGVIIANQAVGYQVTILQGTSNGTTVYSETFNTSSNGYGLVNLDIGTGTTSYDFSTIDWSNGPYYIETAVDVNGGTSYTVMGTSQLLSVPYALHAKTAESLTNTPVPNVVRGTIQGGFSPQVVTGSGYSVVWLNDGWYEITFLTPFNTAPTVVASLFNTNFVDAGVSVTQVTNSSFHIKTGIGSSTTNYQHVNTLDFSFIAITE